ncbi:GntR family transcriptional regulator [Siculibacillus lacustris]|uniref:GntR family transcriptional regulator n=1 Tax=Siculibacillus lacustris TaxID=1549641 RepID=A0A4Q9VXC8_9HYPH|nr:GntR family transcriptional regulator [Siculibacillus lacustris]TBW41038.1 GntR family transcriptional regulator [Siculibacillus lacustris]
MKLKGIDIGQMASASAVIYDSLREAINAGDLAEGQSLRQDAIAKLFNVSRIPVREALTRLEEQGLVVTQRYRGAVVARQSVEEIAEIFEFRALLEPEVIARSVERMSAATLERARAACEAFAAEREPGRWGDLNRAFHATLYEDAGRPYYLQVVNAALDRVDRHLRAQLVLTDGMDQARREHLAIFEACARRDAVTAARLTRDHILDAGRALIDFLTASRGA